jgi:hypothetical protein
MVVHRGHARTAALPQRVTAAGHGVDRDSGGVGEAGGGAAALQ